MKRSFWLSVMAIGLLPLLLGTSTASAAGFIQKTVQCPKTGFNLIPAGNRLAIKDLIVSTNAATNVTLKFNPPQIILMTAFMQANETVVSNFGGEVEGEKEQALKMDCSGNAIVSVTVVGTASF